MMANKGVLSGIGGIPIPKPSTDDTDGAVSITLHLGEGQNQPKLNGCFISANEEFFKLTDADDKYRKVRKKSTFFIYFCFKEHLEEVKGEIRVHCSYRKGIDKHCETESDNILIPHDDGCHVFLPASQKKLNTLRCKMFLSDISKKIPSRFHALKAGIHKGLQERAGLTVFVDIELELNGDYKLFVISDKTFEKLVNGPLLSSNEVVGYYFKDQGDNKMTVYLLGREETKDVWKKSYINSPNRGEVLYGTQQGPSGISQVDSAYSIPSDFEISPSSHENGNSNYIKLCNLLVVVGTKVLKDVFDSIHPPESLHEVLQSSLIHNLLKNLKSKRLIYNQQWNILYPTSGSVTSSNFDITLLFLLLRHICSLKAPVTGWYNQPKSTDFSLQADLVRLKICRNELVHNPSVQALSESEMEKKFLEIEAALTRLSCNRYLREIQKLKSQAIVSESESSVEAPMQAREAEVYRRNILDTMQRIDRRLEQMATSSSPVQIKINCSFKQIAAGGTALIWAALSASILNHYRDEPDRMIDLFQNIILPGAFATVAIVSALLQGSVEILVEVQSLAALKQLWKRCKDGELAKNLKENIISDGFLGLTSDDMKKMDISVKILDKDYRKAQENLIEIARKTAELLDDESTALDSPTNKEVHLIDAKGRSTPLIYESLKLSWPELYQLYRENGATLIPGNDRIVIDVEDPVKGVTRAIADSNENPNVADITGKTPLINAAQYHMARISKKLIEAGADIHLTDGNDETALIYALRGGNKKISLALVNAGADINFRDKYERTPLIYAFQNHWPVIAEKLMKDGAEINVAKDDKAAIGTALVWAAKKGHEKITQALIKARVDVNFRDKDRRTALMYAASNNNNGNKETIARMLIDAGADVNAVDREGKTALNWAAKNGSEEIIQSLLAAGADINVKDKYQNTPFMTAVQEEQESIMGILNDVLQKGI